MSDFWANEDARQVEAGNPTYAPGDSDMGDGRRAAIDRLLARLAEAEATIARVRAVLNRKCNCDQCYGGMPEDCILADVRAAIEGNQTRDEILAAEIRGYK